VIDRYDELMLGLYRGFVPDWLPAASRELYQRESLRRRCDLGQQLARDYRCTVYCAQALFSPEFVQDVCSAWPDVRFDAPNVTTGLYLALDAVLGATPGADAVRELLHYEALAVADLRCDPRAPRVAEPPTDLASAEVYRFRHAVPELHARMTLYAGALAPAAFVRGCAAPRRTTWIARTRAGRGWSVTDVTPQFQPAEADDDTSSVH
jgi:hypothetical protein